jgi:hypothetical protein
MKRLLPRLLFLAVLGGGLLLWSHLRRPRDFTVQIDLTEAMPGDLVEADVVVRRGGHALARHDVRYGAPGAPGTLDIPVHAPPGEVDVEVTLVPSKGPSRRVQSRLQLAPGIPGRMSAR